MDYILTYSVGLLLLRTIQTAEQQCLLATLQGTFNRLQLRIWYFRLARQALAMQTRIVGTRQAPYASAMHMNARKTTILKPNRELNAKNVGPGTDADIIPVGA